MGDDDASKSTVRSKSKKTLCSYFAQKKTRVGCSSNEHDEGISQKSPNVLTHLDFLTKSEQTLKNEQTLTSHTPQSPHKITGKEFDYSTKIALCCAMTEGAKTTISRQSPSLNRLADGKSRLNLFYDSDSSEQSGSKKSGVQSKARSFEENSQDSKSVDLKQQTPRENKYNGPRFYQRRSSSPTTSEISSNDSSHTQASGRLLQNQRPILSQRRSADNLVASINGSPPVSSRSVSHVHKYKKRSASHDTMLLPNSKSKENNAKSEKNSDSSSTTGSSKNQKFVASMDSLARHSLLAAQVLHLIPTIKARERNYLHGRIAANSLLGSLELERTLPHRELRIFVGTWNMNGHAPPEELNDFMLPSTLEHVPDVVTVGTQESFSERFEWEVSIQETIGPSHLLLHSAVLGTLHLAVFIRRDLLWFCSVAEESSYSVRPGTAFRTKGAVAIAFMLFGTSYLFITSHLTAHMDKVKERVQDVKRIMRALDLPKILPIRQKSKDVTQNFDYVFWCGDLNFRLSQPREEVLQWVSEQEFPLPLPHSLHYDQLKTIITEGSIFQDFEEGPITFPPTYKYDPGTQMFDTSHKQRTPAYTDRILYKYHIGRGVLQCLYYSSVPSICTSDHKPVWGLYSTAVRPGIDTIPLAAGLFNREVYLEGIKRRAAALDRSQGTSAICSIQ